MKKHAVRALRSAAERSRRLRNRLAEYAPAISGARVLPHFVILGAQKCGTTSLYEYLSQHPQVRVAPYEEIHYFDLQYHRGIGWYRMHFPTRRSLSANRITGEKSPYYLFHPLAACRMVQHLPDAKLIALLRNPVGRAVSHYFHERRRGTETLPLAEALQREEERLAEEREKVAGDETYRSAAVRNFSYKKRGIYADQIERYLRCFDRSQLLVLSSEEFFADPDAALVRVFEFLDIDLGVRIPDLAVRRAAPRETRVPPDLRKELDEYFRPHNERLFDLLGERFAWDGR